MKGLSFRMIKKCLIYFAIVSFALILIIEALMYNNSHKHIINTNKTNLKLASKVVQNFVDKNFDSVNYEKATHDIFTSLNTDIASDKKIHIAFIDNSGNILSSSSSDFYTPEILKKLNLPDTGNTIAFNQQYNSDILYFNKYNSETKTTISLSVALGDISSLKDVTFFCIGMSILLLFSAYIILWKLLNKHVLIPLNHLVQAVELISNGNYSKRAFANSNGSVLKLTSAFNKMAEKLEKTLHELRTENIKNSSVLNSMLNGIIAIDNSYKIIMINQTACNFFKIHNQNDVFGKNIIEFVRNKQINDQIKSTMSTNSNFVNEVDLNSRTNKVLRIYTNPIKSVSRNDINSGVIIFVHDITDMKKLENLRSEFVSNVTHELKTPLTSIRGFVETLKNGAIEDKQVALKFIEIIDIESERLYVLINDILQLSEIETKNIDTNISINTFNEILMEVLSILNSSASKKCISLNCNIFEPISIYANRDRIKQLLINLIDNCIKYTNENGHVTISATKQKNSLIIHIKDTGIGIPKNEIPRIFERFYRVDKGRSRSAGGTGLGLSIVKHIVNLYHGSINVESTPNVGTKFTIELPIIEQQKHGTP